MNAPGVAGQASGTIRMTVAFVLLFASLSLVVWRQSRALDALRVLDVARAERVLLQSERTDLEREIQRLESRGHVVSAAARLGLRVPARDEIVLLHEPAYVGEPAPVRSDVAPGRRVAVEERR